MFDYIQTKMKWLSVDIGIKNMAYCIFTLENGEINVVDWNVINLIETAKPTLHTCSAQIMSKKVAKCCGKKAKYSKGESCFCETHAKNHTEYWIPTKAHTLAFLRKQKVGEMGELYSRVFPEKPLPKTKPEMVDQVFAYYHSRCFVEIPKVSKPNANDTDLVSIGWAIKREFGKLEHMSDVSHVIIENQISPIATRMKTIQGMLAQYFIMRSSDTDTDTLENTEFRESKRTQIHFVSSSNKLKISNHPSTFPTPEITNTNTDNDTATKKSSYSKNKKDGIQLCTRYLANNPSLSKWTHVLETTKKDDLADCFLQGIWFLVHQKIITYAENLKINSV